MARIRIRAAARADIDEALVWYEEQSPGLGARFVLALDRCLKGIAKFPLAHPVFQGNARRAYLDTFPYAVVYVVGTKAIAVIAVLHGSRDTRHWRTRTGV